MAKLRIFQIAKELNISHTDIVSFLTSKKIEVSSHMSPVDESVHQMIMAEFASTTLHPAVIETSPANTPFITIVMSINPYLNCV